MVQIQLNTVHQTGIHIKFQRFSETLPFRMSFYTSCCVNFIALSKAVPFPISSFAKKEMCLYIRKFPINKFPITKLDICIFFVVNSHVHCRPEYAQCINGICAPLKILYTRLTSETLLLGTSRFNQTDLILHPPL